MFQKKTTVLTSMIFLIIASNMAYSKDIISLQSVNPYVNQPTSYSTISVEWTASTEAGDTYYALFLRIWLAIPARRRILSNVHL
jgi:uncharacterized protein YxeA